MAGNGYADDEGCEDEYEEYDIIESTDDYEIVQDVETFQENQYSVSADIYMDDINTNNSNNNANYIGENNQDIDNYTAIGSDADKFHHREQETIDESSNSPNPTNVIGNLNNDNTHRSEKKMDYKDRIQDILQRTGYSHDKTSGQHKYGGPPPNYDGPIPGPGHEIYVGKIPQDIMEDELIPLFEECGVIFELRLMMSGQAKLSKGFCFVTFTEKSAAEEAVERYNDYEIRTSKFMKVNISIPNSRLYLGNIPKNKSKEQISEEVSNYVDGLKEVIVYDMPDNPKIKNRGFAFLGFETHKQASEAKKKIGSETFKIFNMNCIVSWAEALEEPSDEVMSKVKVLYVRNLKSDVTQEDIESLFSEFGKLDKVKRIKDFCFVHFAEREGAVKALEQLNNKLIKDSVMNITLARPPVDPKVKEQKKAQHTALRNYTSDNPAGSPGINHSLIRMPNKSAWRHQGAGPSRGGRQYQYYDNYNNQSYEEDYYQDDYFYGNQGYYDSHNFEWHSSQSRLAPPPRRGRGQSRTRGSSSGRAPLGPPPVSGSSMTSKPLLRDPEMSRLTNDGPKPLMAFRLPSSAGTGTRGTGPKASGFANVRGGSRGGRGYAMKRKITNEHLFGVDNPAKQVKYNHPPSLQNFDGPNVAGQQKQQEPQQQHQANKKKDDTWETQPIAQKPLNQMMMGFGIQWF